MMRLEAARLYHWSHMLVMLDDERQVTSMKFLHTRFKVRDLERAIRFYEENFACRVRVRHKSGRGTELAHMTLPGGHADLELAYLPWDPDFKLDEDIIHIAFEVDDITATVAALRSNGVKITEEPSSNPSGSRIAFVEDPDGYEIELVQHAAQ